MYFEVDIFFVEVDGTERAGVTFSQKKYFKRYHYKSTTTVLVGA